MGDEAFNEGFDILEQTNLDYEYESSQMYFNDDDFGYGIAGFDGTVIQHF